MSPIDAEGPAPIRRALTYYDVDRCAVHYSPRTLIFTVS
jgi:hypothetical protein